MPTALLERCAGHPVRELAPGDVLMTEGGRSNLLFVLVEGRFEVAHQGSVIATVAEPGAVLGEVSILLGSDHGATVTATVPSRVHVMEEPLDALMADAEALLEVARGLARRLNRLNAYLSDIKEQYGNESGHLGMVDEVLAQLSFGEHPAVEPGSERDPDPYY